jgi:nicotinate-nucleotide--dimethylbenzimidazole phosphoribosyltransferase
MTDTGQIPGEGLPEHAGTEPGGAPLPQHPAYPGNGAAGQPGWQAGAADGATPEYAFLDQPAPPGGLDDEEDVLLMPGPQGSWSDPQPVPPPPPMPAPDPLPTVPPAASLRSPAPPISVEVPVEVPLEVPLEGALPPVLGNGAAVFVAQHPEAGQAQDGRSEQVSPAGQGQAPVPGAAPAPVQQPATGAAPAEPQPFTPEPPPGAAPQPAAGPAAHQVPPYQEPPAPAAEQPLAAVPQARPGQAAPRRPLHMGPQAQDTPSGGVFVRSLADRGPATTVPGPATGGPEYLDGSRDGAGAFPVQQAGEPDAQAAGAWPAAPEASRESLIPRTDSVPRPASAGPPVPPAAAEPAAQPTAPAAPADPEKTPSGPAAPEAPAQQAQPAEPAVPDIPAQQGPVASEVPVEQGPVASEAPVQPGPAASTQTPGHAVAAPVPGAGPAPAAAEGHAPVDTPAEAPGGAQGPAEPSAAGAPSAAPEAGGADGTAPAEVRPEDQPVAAEAEPAAAPPGAAGAPGPVVPEAAADGAEAPAQPAVAMPEAAEPAPVTPPSEAEAAAPAGPVPGTAPLAAVPSPPQHAAVEPAPGAPDGNPAGAPATRNPEPEAQPAPASAPAKGRRGRRRAAPAVETAPVLEPVPEPVAVPEAPTPQGAGTGPDVEQPAPENGGRPAEPYEPAVRDAVHRVIRERRDVRNGFRPDPIPHDVLLRVLEAAHTAPSVGHSQPWDFVVIRSEKTRERMHALAMHQRDAYAKSLPKARARQFRELKIEAILDTPVNIVVTADPTRGGRHTLGRHTQPQMAPYSSALAVENLWLAARAEGLGVGWVSFFDEREMVAELGLPEHLEVVAYLCVGYVDEFPAEPELMQAGWSQRRPLSWVVHEEEYGNRALPGEEPHDLLEETLRGIRPLDAKALGEAWERQKRMTKPAGALGMLEIISAQLSGLSRHCPPPIPEPAAVAVFAGDHGVHAQGVTPWPQEVTAQMVANILGGGAVCNAFANQVGAEVCVVDVGVAADLTPTPGLLPRKVRPGTADFTAGAAMTREEVLRAIEVGVETARDLVAAGNKALLTGEMGIANTTASAALISVFTGADPAEVTGRGTGINDETHARKVEVVRRALELHQPDADDPVGVLAAVGGLEHAAMTGLLLGAAALRTPVILDGVSAGAAALVARAIAPEVLAACIAGHRSAEPGHVAALTTLGLRPLVDLDLRLGEGTGALLALPLVQSAARAMHEVATFDAAGVTEK